MVEVSFILERGRRLEEEEHPEVDLAAVDQVQRGVVRLGAEEQLEVVVVEQGGVGFERVDVGVVVLDHLEELGED